MIKHILRYVPTVKTEEGLCKRLSISFSGGRTSAVMTKYLLDELKTFTDYRVDVRVLFANTGCEHEETLQFVQKCNDAFGFNVIWLEAEIGPKGIGPRAKVVDYKTAARNGEPFEAAIQKHGVFCRTHPNCTGRLKVEPMEQYIRGQVGWRKGTYGTAIGIRADEMDRISSRRKKEVLLYPLVDIDYDTQRVLEIYNSWDFSLNLPGNHYGNCVWCWKKSMRKLLTLAKNEPEVFNFPREMEKKYGHIGGQIGNRVFFRGPTSTTQLLHDAQTKSFVEYQHTMDYLPPIEDPLDEGGGCGDGCEIYSDT